METVSIVLLAGLIVFFLIQVIYYLVYLAKPTRYQNKVDKGEIVSPNSKPAVSVIICAQNESRNLTDFLPSILDQDYPEFEVIVVNDGSTDETENMLSQLETKYSNLYQTYVPRQAKNLSRRKLAVTIGIKASKYDVLLFTEANCKPLSKNWISSMAGHFNPDINLVLGFSTLSKSHNLITKYAAYDNLYAGLQYLSLALFNKPYMGIGRNLAYKKELFYNHKGFSKHLNLQAGEDDLFVNEVLKKENTAIEISSQSITLSNFEDINIWKEIKISHATTQRYFKSGPVAFWRFEAFSKCGYLGFLILSIIYGLPGILLPSIAAGTFILRMIIQMIVINKSGRKLNVEKFYITLPFFDIGQPLIDIYFYIYRILKGKKDYTWR